MACFLNQHRRMPLARGNANAREQAGHDAAVGIRKNGAQENAAALRVHFVVERLDETLVRKAALVRELHFHRHLAIAVPQFPGARELVEFQQRVFIHVRVDMDGINRHNRREQRARARNCRRRNCLP